MNIIFFGSAKFAAPSLEGLLATKHSVSCIVTQPDRQRGRGLHLEGTVVKALAEKSGLRVYQPQRINAKEAIEFLKHLNPDLFVVIAYGQILSLKVLSLAQMFAINLHASNLPKYRGAAPINWAIINGEKTTGVTIIKMTEKMDAGPIIERKTLEIEEDDTSVSLEEKLSRIARELLLGSLSAIESNNYTLTEQDEKEATFAPKLKKEDGMINWNKSARDIFNLVRGCLNWPGAYTYYNGKVLKIHKARVSSQVLEFASSNPGEILEASKEGIVVFTGKGNIIIEELQIEGKRRMRVDEFITGHKICVGEVLGRKQL